jgi:hypothetical protein
MSELCPSCGVQIPAIRDAFCPECRCSLDELPAAPSSNQLPVEQPPLARSEIAGQRGEGQWARPLSGIVGAEGLTVGDLADELERGGRLVIYYYCISVGILTFHRSSKVHLVREGESAVAKSLGYTLLSLVAGWWGFPWGFIYTPMAVIRNLGGGKDVTSAVVGRLQ